MAGAAHSVSGRFGHDVDNIQRAIGRVCEDACTVGRFTFHLFFSREHMAFWAVDPFFKKGLLPSHDKIAIFCVNLRG
jgi:hypothetical protein